MIERSLMGSYRAMHRDPCIVGPKVVPALALKT